MSPKIQIVNGPPFRSFVFGSHLSDNLTDLLTFTVKAPGGEMESEVKMAILFLGRPNRSKEGSEDVHGFIGCTTIEARFMGSVMSLEQKFYVGTYNTRTRKGSCQWFNHLECSRSPVFCALFGI